MKTAAHVFKTFPQFSELTFSDREKYEELIADYPPISDITFPMLMVWWSALDNCRVAQLNSNLVISYWIPGEEEGSGLSIIGTNKIDESICTIFDYQLEKGTSPKLVHVPEFVLTNINYPGIFKVKDERKYDEFVISTDYFVSMKGMPELKKERVRKALIDISKQKVSVRPLDLSNIINQELLSSMCKYWNKGLFNAMGKHQAECVEQSIWYADDLGFKYLCLFIDDRIASFIIYQNSFDAEMAIVNFARYNYNIPQIFEISCTHFCGWFLERGIKFLNIQEDLGTDLSRNTKLGMAPVNFFRKYTVEPRS